MASVNLVVSRPQSWCAYSWACNWYSVSFLQCVQCILIISRLNVRAGSCFYTLRPSECGVLPFRLYPYLSNAWSHLDFKEFVYLACSPWKLKWMLLLPKDEEWPSGAAGDQHPAAKQAQFGLSFSQSLALMGTSLLFILLAPSTECLSLNLSNRLFIITVFTTCYPIMIICLSFIPQLCLCPGLGP